jgi:hypothetical protein
MSSFRNDSIQPEPLLLVGESRMNRYIVTRWEEKMVSKSSSGSNKISGKA